MALLWALAAYGEGALIDHDALLCNTALLQTADVGPTLASLKQREIISDPLLMKGNRLVVWSSDSRGAKGKVPAAAQGCVAKSSLFLAQVLVIYIKFPTLDPAQCESFRRSFFAFLAQL